MRNKEIVQEIVDFVPTIDFTHTNTTASLFETTVFLSILETSFRLIMNRFDILEECCRDMIYSKDH